VLIESSGYEMTSADERDLYEQIENLYQIEPSMRRLLTLRNIVNRRVAEHLHKWVGDGQYGSLFDNIEDTLPWRGFSASTSRAWTNIRRSWNRSCSTSCTGRMPPSMPLIWQQPSSVCDGRSLALLPQPTIKQYVVAALKTWRKKNAAMILATQSGDDLYRSELLR